MENIKVSIIMSVYNEEIKWIKECINSILNQTYSNFEFIIVIDNPDNKNLSEYIENRSLSDSRIIIIKNKKNLGLVASLNKALQRCSGRLIARMDADDIADIDRIQKQVQYMSEHKDVSLIGTKVRFIDENSNNISRDKYRPTTHNDIKEHLKIGNAFAHPTIMFTKNLIEDIGGYSEIKYAEDYFLVTTAILKGYKVANIDECLLSYRIRQTSISQSNSTIQFITTEYLKSIYNNGLKGKNILFNQGEIEKKLNDIKEINNANRYLELTEQIEKESSIGLYLKLLSFAFTSIGNFKLVSKKVVSKLKRKF